VPPRQEEVGRLPKKNVTQGRSTKSNPHDVEILYRFVTTRAAAETILFGDLAAFLSAMKRVDATLAICCQRAGFQQLQTVNLFRL
jgi:hypothetical protein